METKFLRGDNSNPNKNSWIFNKISKHDKNEKLILFYCSDEFYNRLIIAMKEKFSYEEYCEKKSYWDDVRKDEEINDIIKNMHDEYEEIHKKELAVENEKKEIINNRKQKYGWLVYGILNKLIWKDD